MLIAIVVALLQAGADPAPQAAPVDPPAVTAEAPAATTATQQASQADEPRPRRCRARAVTGTRLQTLVVCRSREGVQDQDTRDALHDMQRPAGTNGG